MIQLQAAYVLEAVHAGLEDWAGEDTARRLALAGLWQRLSTFDLVTTLPDASAPDPISELAVATNLLTRGLPTLASIFVEEAFAKTCGRTARVDVADRGSITFPLSADMPLDAERLVDALHPVDPRYQNARSYYDTNDLGSGEFEEALVTTYTLAQPALAQLLQKQRPLPTLAEGFNAGNVDFSLEVPTRDAHVRNNMYHRPVTLRRTKVYVLEVDGARYHEASVDAARDFATANMGHDTSRVLQGNPQHGADAFIRKIKQEPYYQRCASNLADIGFAERPETLLVLAPVAVARIQRTVLWFLTREARRALAQARTLRLGVIERDIACAQVAIDDLNLTLARLFALNSAGKAAMKIVLTVLEPNGVSGERLEDFDLVIDHAILRRTGIWREDRQWHDLPNVCVVRTCHYVADDTHSPVVSAAPIVYRPLVEALDNDRYVDIEDAVNLLTPLLQNVFRKVSFRAGQLPILDRALQGKTVIGLLPTGGGKSLTYQLAALLQPGITIVIDPIRSLMADQDRGLRAIGIDKTAFLNSTLERAEKTYVQNELLAHGRLQFVFVSPERFVIKEFREALATLGRGGHAVAYAIIDEAHCVSEWGHDFRIPYLDLGRNAQDFCSTWREARLPLFGLTATASFDVLADIERELQINENDGNAVVRFENTVRDEIIYRIEHVAADPLPNGEAATQWSPNKQVGGAKQARIYELLAAAESELMSYNESLSIRSIIHHSLDNYAPLAAREAFASATGGAEAARERHFSNRITRLVLPKGGQAFAKTQERYNYGHIVFTPHRNGWLGIHSGNKSQGCVYGASSCATGICRILHGRRRWGRHGRG